MKTMDSTIKKVSNNEYLVEGKTPNVCLDKIQEYLKISRNKLSYVVEQKGVSNLLGSINFPYKLKVRIKDDNDVSAEPQMPEDAEISEEISDGLPAEDAVVKDEDLEELKKAIESVDEISDRDDYTKNYEVHYSDNRTRAYLKLTNPEAVKRKSDEIYKRLKNYGLRLILSEKEFEEALNEGKENILIAEGIVPKSSKDAYIEYNFKTRKDRAPKINAEDGAADYYNMDLIENVAADQLLAVKREKEEGKQGLDVFGNVLPVDEPKDAVLNGGKNTYFSDDGLRLFAKLNGEVKLKGNAVSVEPLLTIKTDIDFKTGNIYFLGTVVIGGSIKDGFKVNAAEDIIVKGTIGNAEVEADGNIQVRGGIIGRETNLIKAGGSIYSKFVENSNLKAGRNIIINEVILHSNVDAGGYVYLSGKKAAVIGKKIRAGKGIYAKEIGSTANTLTEAVAGVHYKVLDKINDINKQITESKNKYIKVYQALKLISKKPPSQQAKFSELQTKLMSEAKTLKISIDRLKNEMEAVKTEVNLKLTQKPSINVKTVAYPNVLIKIRKEQLHLKKAKHAVCFYEEAGRINEKAVEQLELKNLEAEDDVNTAD